MATSDLTASDRTSFPPIASGEFSAGVSRWLRFPALLVLVLIGALQAYAFRHTMNPDGLSYLDSARAFASGDIATGLNPHWGPLYPAVVGLTFALVDPGITALIPVAHAVSLLFFLIALAAFDFFLRELLRGSTLEPRSATAAALFAYGVFAYAAFVLIGLRLVTPDMAVMASVFVGSGFMLRMRRLGVTFRRAALLGLVLALGYFAKSVMFVLGIAFIGGLLFMPTGAFWNRPWRAIAVAGGVFLALASLLVVPFSQGTGTLTFGTAGKLAYNWEVNGVQYTNWQGDARSRLVHPPRQMRTAPDLFEYSRHVVGTYPPWYEPAYWNAGTVVPISPRKQVLQLYRSTKFYLGLFFGSEAVLATLLALLAVLTAKRSLRDYAMLWLPSLGALAIYWPVHLEARYVAPFAALLWIVPVATAAPRNPDQGRTLATAFRLGALLLVGPIVLRTLGDVWTRGDDSNPFPIVATELNRLGLASGDLVANVSQRRGENYGSSFEGYWAYLAGLRIVAEVPMQRDFLCRDAATTEAVFRDMASVGARAVVTRNIPVAACAVGWQPIEGTDFYVRLLSPRPK